MNLVIRSFGLIDYTTCWSAMRRFTDAREAHTSDELWSVQHQPVFTLGRAGKRAHILAAGNIPVVESDRGGQVTYHAPGQVVVYTLLDIRRLDIGPRELVRRIEQGIIDFLAADDVAAERRAGAPGVYTGGAKIAALGLRIRNGCSFHGLALNVAMDLEPYLRINPCGYAGLRVTQLSDHCAISDCATAERGLLEQLRRNLYPGRDVSPRYAGAPDAVTSELLAG